MKDDGVAAPLSRRVPGSTRSGPSQRAKPTLSDTDVHRIRAAIDAEHANTEKPIHREPSTEPIPVVTEAPRADEALRAAKALRAAEELRVAEKPRVVEKPRAAKPRATQQAPSADGRVEEPVRAEEPVRVPEPVGVPEPVRVEEPVIAAQPVGTAAPVRTAEPQQSAEPRTAWPPNEPPPGTIGWLWPDDTATRGGSRRWHRPGWWTASGWWRYRTATLVVFSAVLLAAGALVLGMFLHSPLIGTGAHAATSGPKASTHAPASKSKRHAGRGSRASGHHSTKTKRINLANPAVATNRTAAASWVARQVGAAAVVACDAQTCAALTNSGFSGHQLQIGMKSTSLLNVGLVIVTPELRTLITATHPSLGADVAPTDLASFGSGNAEVTVQVVYPGGAAAYEAALSQSVQTRMKVGEQLLNTGKVSASAAAENDLAAGAVDPRLLLVLKAMANLEPVDVVGFADSGPGASAGVPFRLMALAETDPAASVSASAYLQAMLHLLQAHATFPAFTHVGQATLPDGQKVVQVEYAAPSPLTG